MRMHSMHAGQNGFLFRVAAKPALLPAAAFSVGLSPPLASCLKCPPEAQLRASSFRMKHVAALLLAQLGGNANPGEADVKKILSSVGVEADSEKLSKLISEVSGKDISALIAEGKSKLASLPAGGAAVAAAPAAGGGAAAAAAPAAKKEEKKEESEQEDMGFSLFD